jgi:Nitroreductase family
MMTPLAKQFSTEVDIVCNAPVLVLVCAEKDERWTNINLLDSVLAARNMFLKAYELGLGTFCMDLSTF